MTLLVGWQDGPVKETEWWGAGMVICLGRVAALHMAKLLQLPLTVSCSSKSILVLPSWFYLSGTGLPRRRQNPKSRKMVVIVVVVFLKR